MDSGLGRFRGPGTGLEVKGPDGILTLGLTEHVDLGTFLGSVGISFSPL